MAPLRIFTGWDERQAEAVEVFAHSVRERCTVEAQLCYVPPLARPGRTAFTYARFLIPHVCDYKDRALFADGADTLCLGDVAELADFDMGGAAVAVVRHGGPERQRVWSAVMLMDCARLGCWTPEVVATASDDQLMRLRDLADDEIADLPPEWHVLVQPGDEPPDGTKIAHWSAISDPNAGNWIDVSRSTTWAAARQRWRDERDAA